MSTEKQGMLHIQVEAMRANAEAVVASCDLILLTLMGGNSPAPEGCQHPKESRVDTSTMGEPPTFHCNACHENILSIYSEHP